VAEPYKGAKNVFLSGNLVVWVKIFCGIFEDDTNKISVFGVLANHPPPPLSNLEKRKKISDVEWLLFL
jgi:hypothetical protein